MVNWRHKGLFVQRNALLWGSPLTSQRSHELHNHWPLSGYIINIIAAMGWGCVSVELRPLTGPLSIPQMIHEWIWSSGGSRRTLRKNLSQCQHHFVHHRSHMANPGLHGEKPVFNRLSYGTATCQDITAHCCARNTAMWRPPHGCHRWLNISKLTRSHNTWQVTSAVNSVTPDIVTEVHVIFLGSSWRMLVQYVAKQRSQINAGPSLAHCTQPLQLIKTTARNKALN
jgi:hypothetical protein